MAMIFNLHAALALAFVLSGWQKSVAGGLIDWSLALKEYFAEERDRVQIQSGLTVGHAVFRDPDAPTTCSASQFATPKQS